MIFKILKVSTLILFIFSFSLAKNKGKGQGKTIELRLNTLENYLTKKQIKEFEKNIKQKYKQNVKVILTPGYDPADGFTGFRSKSQDVAMVPHHILKDERYHFINKKLVMPINVDLVPNIKDGNKDMADLDFFKKGSVLYAVPFATGPYGLLGNVTADPSIEKKVKSWNALWDPNFKKKYSTTFDYYECNIYLTALALGRSGEEMYDYDSLKDDKIFMKKLTELAKNADHLWIGYENIEKNKSLLLSAGWGFERVNARKKLKQTWKFLPMKEGVTGWVDSHAIGAHVAKDELKTKIAHEMVNYLISPEIQADIVVKSLNVYPFNVGSKVRKRLNDKEVEAARLNDPGFFKREQILFPILNNRQRKGIEKLWREALAGAGLKKLLPKLKSK